MSEASPAPAPGEAPPPAYSDWIDKYDRLDERGRHELRSRVAEITDPPLISVVMPVYEPSEEHLREAIESVVGQIYPFWELCIADDASTSEWVPDVLAHYERADARIHVARRTTNGHISVATNTAISLASGEFIAFLDHDDKLAETALALVALAIADSPDLGLLYSDEDKIDLEGTRSSPYFKPDWDPILLLGQNYLTHFSVVRRDHLHAVGGLREGYASGTERGERGLPDRGEGVQ